MKRIGTYGSDLKVTSAHEMGWNRHVPGYNKAKRKRKDYDDGESSEPETDILDDDYQD